MTVRLIILLLFFLTPLANARVYAQGDRPQALLRFNEDKSAPDSQRFYIEILTDKPLNNTDFEALKASMDPKLGVLVSKGIPIESTAEFTNTVVASPADDPTRFRIYLPKSMAPFTDFDKKKFAVLVTNFVDTTGVNQVRGINVVRVLTPELAIDFPVCLPDQFSIHLDYDKDDPYSLMRAEQLYDELTTYVDDPGKLRNVKIKVEPLKQKKVSTLDVTRVRLNPDTKAALMLNATLTACLETSKDAPTEKFDAQLLWNNQILTDAIEPTLTLGLAGRSFESSPKVFVDKEKGVGIRPIDKDLNIAVSLISSVEDNEKPDKSIVRERTTRTTLDMRIGLFRNTEQLTVRNLGGANTPPSKICGPVTAYTASTSTTSGTITINAQTFGIAAGINLGNVKVGSDQCLHFLYPPIGIDAAGNSILGDQNPLHAGDPAFAPRVTELQSPNVTTGTYSILTPFYIDAKVSNGKIIKDTLSLNRIVFGIQEEFRYYQNNFRFPTFHRFLIQGNHASDRDFKQKEYKLTFEFQPVFGSLNHPYDPENTTASKRVLCPNCKNKFKLIPIGYGFEFVPIFGAEIGRTYSRRRPAEAVEPSDTVRRVYFGLNTIINPTERIALTASEIFYIRGESKTDRYHNYFLAETSYRLTNFLRSKAAHAIFFSWERGGQPPFEDPDVNVVKFGYRVTSTTLVSR